MSYTEMTEKFKARVERFIRRYDMTPSEFGRQAMSDPTFVFDLRGGKSPRAETMDRAEAWMRDYKSRAATAATIQAAE